MGTTGDVALESDAKDVEAEDEDEEHATRDDLDLHDVDDRRQQDVALLLR